MKEQELVKQEEIQVKSELDILDTKTNKRGYKKKTEGEKNNSNTESKNSSKNSTKNSTKKSSKKETKSKVETKGGKKYAGPKEVKVNLRNWVTKEKIDEAFRLSLGYDPNIIYSDNLYRVACQFMIDFAIENKTVYSFYTKMHLIRAAYKKGMLYESEKI